MDDSIRNRFQLRAERPRTVLTLFTRATSHARAAVSVNRLSSSFETSKSNQVFREFISSKGCDPRRQRILRCPPFFGGWLTEQRLDSYSTRCCELASSANDNHDGSFSSLPPTTAFARRTSPASPAPPAPRFPVRPLLPGLSDDDKDGPKERPAETSPPCTKPRFRVGQR